MKESFNLENSPDIQGNHGLWNHFSHYQSSQCNILGEIGQSLQFGPINVKWLKSQSRPFLFSIWTSQFTTFSAFERLVELQKLSIFLSPKQEAVSPTVAELFANLNICLKPVFSVRSLPFTVPLGVFKSLWRGTFCAFNCANIHRVHDLQNRSFLKSSPENGQKWPEFLFGAHFRHDATWIH